MTAVFFDNLKHSFTVSLSHLAGKTLTMTVCTNEMHAKVYETLAFVFSLLVNLQCPYFIGKKVQCIYIETLHFSLTVMAEAGEIRR